MTAGRAVDTAIDTATAIALAIATDTSLAASAICASDNLRAGQSQRTCCSSIKCIKKLPAVVVVAVVVRSAFGVLPRG